MLAGQPLFSSPVNFTVTSLLLYFFSKSQPNKLNTVRTIKNQFIPTKESSVKRNLLTLKIPSTNVANIPYFLWHTLFTCVVVRSQGLWNVAFINMGRQSIQKWASGPFTWSILEYFLPYISLIDFSVNSVISLTLKKIMYFLHPV